ncbi:MAG: hypothetical protein PHT80_11440, partial [Lentisphaeria bacterium]|nr:hypothetical protein [Lentisphaeria bacterium]
MERCAVGADLCVRPLFSSREAAKAIYSHAKARRREEDKDKEEWQPVLPLARQFTPPVLRRYFFLTRRRDGGFFSHAKARSREGYLFSREGAKPRRRQRRMAACLAAGAAIHAA